MFATSNPGVTVPTDGTALSSLSVDWVDVTAQIFKNDPAYVSANKNVVVPIAGTYTSQLNWSLTDLNGNEFVPDSFMVAITIGNATNTFQIDVNNY